MPASRRHQYKSSVLRSRCDPMMRSFLRMWLERLLGLFIL